MCAVSNIGDYYRDNLPGRYPWIQPMVPSPTTYPLPYSPPNPLKKYEDVHWADSGAPTREEFDKLKKEVEELKELLKAAKKFDENTGQPHCENDEKVELIKRIANLVGVDMKGVF